MPDKSVDFSLDITRSGSKAIVRCRGKLVAGLDNILYRDVKQLLPEYKCIVLDLTDVTRMDSMGLGRTGSLVRLCAFCRLQSGACQPEQAGHDAVENRQPAIGFFHGLRIQHQDGLSIP